MNTKNMNKGMSASYMPFLVILLGLLLLGRFPEMVGGLFIVLGIVMLIERKWPEKWG